MLKLLRTVFLRTEYDSGNDNCGYRRKMLAICAAIMVPSPLSTYGECAIHGSCSQALKLERVCLTMQRLPSIRKVFPGMSSAPMLSLATDVCSEEHFPPERDTDTSNDTGNSSDTIKVNHLTTRSIYNSHYFILGTWPINNRSSRQF